MLDHLQNLEEIKSIILPQLCNKQVLSLFTISHETSVQLA